MEMIDIISKRISHINTTNFIKIDGYNALSLGLDITQEDISKLVLNGHNHIYLKNISTNPETFAGIIMDIFANKRGLVVGVSIYTDEQPDGFAEIIKQKFNDESFKKPRSVDGISIQHIFGVGYIITTLNTCNQVVQAEYDPEDYMKRLDEYVIIGMAKNEKHYIKDWVAYHLRIGFDKIYLFDNNDDENERYDELLSEYIKDGRLVIVDVRNKRGLQNSIYAASYNTLPYKWMAIIDIDEYIWFNESGKYRDIKTFINDMESQMPRDFFGIILQWHCYAASGDDHPSDAPIWEVNNKLLPFTSRKDCRCEYISDWCKSIYRRGYSMVCNEHFGWSSEWNYETNTMGTGCREFGCNGKQTIKNDFTYVSEEDFKQQQVYVKHFLLRNIDDFFKHKYLRGHAGGDFGIGEDGWRYYQWFQNINYFTDISHTLTEKEQLYLKKHGMKINYTFHPDVFINLYHPQNCKFINEFIEQKILTESILPNANVFLNTIDIIGSNFTQQPFDDSYGLDDNAGLEFLAKNHGVYSYNDSYIWNGISKTIRQDVQEPIVINIGIPVKFLATEIPIEEQMIYLNNLKKLLEPQNIRGMLRSALEKNITTIPSINVVQTPEDCLGYREQLDKFLTEHGLSIPYNRLLANTMIMSYSQFLKLSNFQKDFIDKFGYISNEDICDNARKGVPNIYDMYTCAVLSVIDKPYFVWLT